MRTSYETDVVAWANEQAGFLRDGRFDQLDLEHIADEIEDVAKSEQRELAKRMAMLLAQLLKWQHQPDRRSASLTRIITERRKGVLRRIEKTPSLAGCLNDPDWWADAWGDAFLQSITDLNVNDTDTIPEVCPWTTAEVLGSDWLPA